MERAISILGSTGSVGRQTVDVAEKLGLRVLALAAGGESLSLLEEQARRLRPAYVAVYDGEKARALRLALADTDIAVGAGEQGLTEAAVWPGADTVVTAVSGSVGLRPTLAAIDAKKRIALANKETLVCAGTLVMARSRAAGVEIVPVDSEHSAIFQCLQGCRGGAEVRALLLTGSGGPFRGKTLAETRDVTPAQAVRHPNWRMGAKISVDSATMMNKGLEFIEAMHLFAVPPEKIRVLIHPQSVVHSMVEFTDGAVLAQLGVPDMRIPIQYALTYPARLPSPCERLELTRLAALSFQEPDLENLPCLALAMDCARKGGNAPAVLSAANEAAVSLFLQERIGFHDIFAGVAAALRRIEFLERPSLEDLLASDQAARRVVAERFGQIL